MSDDECACTCGVCTGCAYAIACMEPEEAPTCACGEPVYGSSECKACAFDRAMAALDFADAAE